MKCHRSAPTDAALRRRAQPRLQAKERASQSAIRNPQSKAGTRQLLHDLRARQIELERQNQELQRARDKLQKELEQQADLYDSAPVGCLILRADSTIRQANLTAAGWLEIERSRLLNRRFSRFVFPADRSTFEALLTRAFATKTIEVGEVRLSVKGQPPLSAQLRACVTGGRQECRVAWTDISEIRRAETELHIALEKYRVLFESFPLGISVTDAAGNLRQANRESERLLGIPSDEHARRKYDGSEWRIVRPDGTPLPPDEYASVRAFREKRLVENVEMGIVKGGGEITWINVSAAPIPLEGYGVAIAYGDITARKGAEAELRVSRKQLRALTARLQAVREEERARVAREIHDVLAQELTLLKMDVVWLNRRLALPLDAHRQKVVRERLAVMTAVTDTAIRSVQRIATELRPIVLDSLGLCAAVEWQTRDFQARTGISCTATVPEQDVPLDRNRSTAVFRILQESLTNVLRHARATRIEVLLQTEADQLLLRIQDNGCGIPPKTLNDPMSIGLAGMKERASLADGQLEIRSQPGSGTTIEMRFPLSKDANLPEGQS